MATTAAKKVTPTRPPDADADKDETEPPLHLKRTPTTRNVFHSDAGEAKRRPGRPPRAPDKAPADESDSEPVQKRSKSKEKRADSKGRVKVGKKETDPKRVDNASGSQIRDTVQGVGKPDS